MQNTAFIALQAAAGSIGSNLIIKNIVNRARPEDNVGIFSSQPQGSSKSNSSFTSTHSAVNFALVTPFASEYDAPWLYTVAGLASLGRSANRQHWLSDVVAGSMLGYGAGKWLWSSQRNDKRYQSMLSFGDKSIDIGIKANY
jgi:membrane-associated phospholipid phosphatase